MEYVFTLKYRLAAKIAISTRSSSVWAKPGVTTPPWAWGNLGRIALPSREAESAFEALVSALKDVKNAVLSARLVEAGPDFVGLTDVAELAGVSRQNMRKLMLNHAIDFRRSTEAARIGVASV